MAVVDPLTNAAAAAASAAAANGLLPLPPAREIPSTFSASFKSWWSAGEKDSAASEERLLRRLSYFRPSNVPPCTASESAVTATSTRVPIDTSVPKVQAHLNTLSITSTNPSPNAPPPAVVLHGYGAGLGFFFLNFPALGRWAGSRGSAVYALDWLGMGRSSRVPFTVRARREDTAGRVRESESFFIDALESWRARMGLERMQLVGHSLGGYLSVAYALKYPERVSRLILLSPAGVPRDPDAMDEARELTETQDETTAGPSAAANLNGRGKGGLVQMATKSKVDKVKAEQEVKKREASRSRKIFTYLWEEGFSPFQVVRSTLFWGPMLVGKYSSRRFSSLNEEDTRNLHNYIVNITLAKGSGEYCISHILAPGAHARMPLVDRVAELKVPVTFVYGDHDWMDPVGGLESVENMKAAGNPNGKVLFVPNAGHHLYLDNAKSVNDMLLKELSKPSP